MTTVVANKSRKSASATSKNRKLNLPASDNRETTSSVSHKKSETMRVVLPADIRDKFRSKCESRGQSMSERARQLVVDDVATYVSPAQRFADIRNQAIEINKSSGYNEPTMDEIDAFIANVRNERLTEGL